MSKKRPARSALLGFCIGIFCIVYAIYLAGEAETFFDLTSIFITIGGTLGAVIMSFPPNRLRLLGPVMLKAFTRVKYDLKNDIEILVKLSELSRQKGLLVLESAVDQHTDDEFMKKGVLLLVDGADRDVLRSAMQTELYFMQQRHKKGYGMLEMIASTAPALGLLGTYVGLIPMLLNLRDPDSLGPMMAVELVTSFYGAFIAYIIFTPIAKRLKNMSADEITRKELVIEGLSGIQEGKNPKLLREELVAFMSRKDSKNMKGRKKYEPDAKPEVTKVYGYGNR